MAQRKTNIRFVYKEDLQKYYDAAQSVMQTDEQGNEYFLLKGVDDKIELNLWTPNKVWMEEQITELENELDGMSEPSESELKERGKAEHEYYMTKERLNRLQEEYNEKYE